MISSTLFVAVFLSLRVWLWYSFFQLGKKPSLSIKFDSVKKLEMLAAIQVWNQARV